MRKMYEVNQLHDRGGMPDVSSELKTLYNVAEEYRHPACQKCSRHRDSSHARFPRSCMDHYGANTGGILFVARDPGGSEGGASRTGKLCPRCNHDKTAKRFLELASTIKIPEEYWHFSNAVWHGLNNQNEPPSDQDRKCCKNLLEEQIHILDPKIMVCIGKHAWESVTEIMTGTSVIPTKEELKAGEFMVEVGDRILAYMYHQALGAPNYSKIGLNEADIWKELAMKANVVFGVKDNL